jgi:uncharacterized RDD family membrane protein YckC
MLFQLLWPDAPLSMLTRYVRFIYVITVMFAYFSWCWRRSGQTLAMKTWRLRLLDANGNLLAWRPIAVRFALVLAAFLPLPPAWIWAKHVPAMHWVLWPALAWACLPYVWAVLDRDRQFLHDRLIGARITLMPVNTAA